MSNVVKINSRFDKKDRKFVREIVQLNKLLHAKGERLADAFGGDVESTELFGQEMNALYSSVLNFLEIEDNDWNFDIYYDTVAEKVSIDDFFKLIDYPGNPYNYAYSTERGYYEVKDGDE